MDEERKDIIVKEIKYWKDNQLLPEHYCNFLLMLYTEGEEAEDLESAETTEAPSSNKIGLPFGILFLAFVSLSLTFIITYFTSFSLMVQTLSHICLSILVFTMAVYIKKKDLILFHILVSVGALILFLGSTTSVMRFEENDFLLSFTILLNCSVWLMAGFYWKLPYLKWAGGAGIMLAVLFYILT
ncbi:hypothetical protein D7Z54_23305 [Salibacterium salarium]|uniref:Uncharacterized protein n=1 Tax=Salibacterium salarium TaxID=284579 RepID=A0A3R9Q0C0_9BACI|nr:hypothetical protein [Salibacterium salarium]RSL30905.1 hypothetical protein D7Z54_23305 [Salibacterium salarium]